MKGQEIQSIDQLNQVISEIMPRIMQQSVLALYGNLGTGKTTFTQNLLKQLHFDQAVTSPSYSLINLYDSPHGQVAHADLYRLHSAEEAVNLGLEELIDNSFLTVIEWPEIFEDFLPEETLKIYFKLNQGLRTIAYE